MKQSYDVSGEIYYLDSSNMIKAAPVKRVAISAASSGNNTLLAAVTGKKIRVLAYTLLAAGAVVARFEDGAGGTALTGIMTLGTGIPASPALNNHGHFETTAATLLNLELSGAVQVSGHFTYIEVD